MTTHAMKQSGRVFVINGTESDARALIDCIKQVCNEKDTSYKGYTMAEVLSQMLAFMRRRLDEAAICAIRDNSDEYAVRSAGVAYVRKEISELLSYSYTKLFSEARAGGQVFVAHTLEDESLFKYFLQAWNASQRVTTYFIKAVSDQSKELQRLREIEARGGFLLIPEQNFLWRNTPEGMQALHGPKVYDIECAVDSSEFQETVEKLLGTRLNPYAMEANYHHYFSPDKT